MITIKEFVKKSVCSNYPDVDLSPSDCEELIREYSILVASAVKEACAEQAENYEGIDCMIRNDVDINLFVV